MYNLECLDCGKHFQDAHPAIVRCPQCTVEAIAKAQVLNRAISLCEAVQCSCEAFFVKRSEASLNILPLTLEDRRFLQEMRISCE